MKQTLLNLIAISSFFTNTFGDMHGDDDSHDHDHDSHDHDHGDEHSCHYGLISFFELPMVEDECNYQQPDDVSYKFECESNTKGKVYHYSGTKCDDSNIINETILDMEGTFDCTTEGECTVVRVDYTTYPKTSNNIKCNSDALGESYVQYLTDNAICVYDPYNGHRVTTDVEEDKVTIYYYNDMYCNDTAFVTWEFTEGCSGSGSTYYEYDIDEVDGDNSSGYKLIRIENVFIKCFWITMFVFFWWL